MKSKVIIGILLLFVSIVCVKQKNSLRPGHRLIKNRHNLCVWNQTTTWSMPYQSVAVECCDLQLRKLMLDEIRATRKTVKLGDLAKNIQRRAQTRYRSSFEVIVSEENFGISSHYHGPHSCKIFNGKHYYLIYETPRKYNPFDTRTEDYLSTVDSSDPLGSSRNKGFKREYLDIREDPTAGEDLTIQPKIDYILRYPNKFASPNIKEVPLHEYEEAERRAILEMEKLMESITSMTIDSMGNGTHFLNGTDFELPNPRAIPRDFQNLRIPEKLPEGTHCDKTRRDGNRCCDGRLGITMKEAMIKMATSPEFGSDRSESIIASEIQDRVQLRYEQSFEVIVSKTDFIINSRYPGQLFCKFENRGYMIAAFATPRQYDINEDEIENKLGSTMNPDPLGSNKTSFENEDPFHHELQVEQSGERAGYPVGSHCSDKRTGSRCCSLMMFNSMQKGYNEQIATKTFNLYDMRKIASAIQYNVEEDFQHSAEVIVSFDDFVYATHREDLNICKYRVDRYHVLAYLTPVNKDDEDDENLNRAITQIDNEQNGMGLPSLIGTPYTYNMQVPTQGQNVFQQIPAPQVAQSFYQQGFQNYPPMYINQNILKRVKRQFGITPYPLHSSPYNDIGSAKPFMCPAGLDALAGVVACDGEVSYEAISTIDIEKQKPGYNRHNLRNLAFELTKAVERRFGTTFETIVGEGDFTWKTNSYNQRAMKFDSDGYNILTFQSSPNPPPESDFIDTPNDPTLQGPNGQNNGPSQSGNNNLDGDPRFISENGQQFPQPFQQFPQPFQQFPQPFQQFPQPPQWPQWPQWQPAPLPPPPPPPPPPAPVVFQPVVYDAPYVPGILDRACFSVDTMVTTPNGKKRMDELQIGDYVLTSGVKKQLFYAPITLWIHREPEKDQQFVTIVTSTGKTLRLTSKHFIFRKKCGEFNDQLVTILPYDQEAVQAEELEVDDCVYVHNKNGHELQKIVKIYTSSKKGIYSPLTSNGRIIVNDMLASCYSEVQQTTLQKTFFWISHQFRSMILEVFGKLSHGNIEIPTITSFGKEILELVVPVQK